MDGRNLGFGFGFRIRMLLVRMGVFRYGFLVLGVAGRFSVYLFFFFREEFRLVSGSS